MTANTYFAYQSAGKSCNDRLQVKGQELCILTNLLCKLFAMKWQTKQEDWKKVDLGLRDRKINR